MNKALALFLFLIIVHKTVICQSPANRPDSAFLFAYTPANPAERTGLAFAWSSDCGFWNAIGPEHYFILSDYGAWGSQKKMIHPYLFQDKKGTWQLVWSLNDKDNVFAHAASKDLIYWGRQSYPQVQTGSPIENLVINNQQNKNYTIAWQNAEMAYKLSTQNFKTFSSEEKLPNYKNDRAEAIILGKIQTGTIHRVAFSVIEGLLNAQKLAQYQNIQNSEITAADVQRFNNLKEVSVSIIPQLKHSKKISDLLVGAFFEDINYGADGGLYAELLQNRDFEYQLSDKKNRDNSWNSTKAWKVNNAGADIKIDTTAPLHINNKHYVVLNIHKTGAGLVNEGYDGISVSAGEKYDFSIFARQVTGKGKIKLQLLNKDGQVVGEAITIPLKGNKWQKYNAVIAATKTVKDARLLIAPQFTGTVNLDMISLFPQNTYKNRKNGLRADLAQALADIKPKFLRFPGGCVAHGDGLANIYRWKNTIGPLEARKPMRNLWNYHQSMGLGYYEYFRYCEDMGAEPLPVLAAGVPCQNSSTGGAGQQCGIPMGEMDEYVQDILDLIEWANGDAKTTKWGKVRAQLGHPKPFNLKYIGIGNEDLITDIFEERFTMIFKAIKNKYPYIKVIGTSGPFYEGTDYVEGWDIAHKLRVDMIDEHYYVPPGWLINNQDYYDKYDRNGSKVYLGEYASHLPGRPNNIETALTEALHLNNLERNGDIVAMSSYAPLFAKEGHTQWNPDLIYFTNSEVKLTPGYYVQYLYGNNAGDIYIPSHVSYSSNNDLVTKRISTSIVKNSKTNELYIKMVNLLPVVVNAELNLLELIKENKIAEKTTLSGTPADRKAKPIAAEEVLTVNSKQALPAYSLTVWKIKL